MVVLTPGNEITISHLPAFLRREHPSIDNLNIDLPSQGISLEAIEKELILKALEKFNWNETHAAKYLDISRKTLIYRLEKHGIRKKAAEDEEELDSPDDVRTLLTGESKTALAASIRRSIFAKCFETRSRFVSAALGIGCWCCRAISSSEWMLCTCSAARDRSRRRVRRSSSLISGAALPLPSTQIRRTALWFCAGRFGNSPRSAITSGGCARYRSNDAD